MTATVDSIPLIASSIMSKKLASGADAIVLDVKCGNGAFMKNEEDACKLAKVMVDIGKSAGKKIAALVTDMNQPLGRSVGNALEVIEAIEVLDGRGSEDLMEISLELGAYMAVFGGYCDDILKAKESLKETIRSKSALNKLKEFVKAQGGDTKYIDDTSLFEQGCIKEEVYMGTEGEISYVNSICTEAIGLASLTLGGGRKDKESKIDLSVGIILNKKIGDKIEGRTSVATIYGNATDKVKKAQDIITNAYKLSKNKADCNVLIKKVIDYTQNRC